MADFDRFFQVTLEMLATANRDGYFVDLNPMWTRVLGYSLDELRSQPFIEFVHPDDVEPTIAVAATLFTGVELVTFENRYRHKDGRVVHIMWSARWSEADGLRIGVARDVTRQKRAEAIQIATYAVSEAAHQATDLDSLFEWIHTIIAGRVALAGLAVAIRDPHSGALDFPYQRGERGAAPILDDARARTLCARVMADGTALHLASDALVQVAIGHDPGDASWLILPLIIRQETIGALVLQAPVGARYDDADLELLHFVSAQVATAIEHGQLKAQLLRAAQYDELTNLPNRRLFHDRLDTALARSQRKRGRMALLYIDVDDFKHVNDTLGHAAGDVLLQHIARRLEACVRKADTVARLGGDEFVVILEEVHGAKDADAVADKIRSVLREGITLGGRLLHTEASIGVAIYPDDGTHAEALLKHADGGMDR